MRGFDATIFGGRETLEVVGESNYQEALWQIVGGFRRDPVRHPCRAVLLPEPENPHDANAIRVIVDGQLVGYLSREDAAAYLPGLHRLAASCPSGRVGLNGQVVGGGPRADGIGFLGVFLDHNPADFGIAAHYTTGGSLRTGLSEAIATDWEDDSYDLSWLNTLGEDDDAAVARLRALLVDEHDPIDRHYMLCELESRLYRLRETRATALEEFDAACTQHHEEMPGLRAALVEKFGCVPVIEMYRQAAIRCQKARRWQDALVWAQRGLDVYGDQAARQEAVDDLHKRQAHAHAKIEEASRPHERKPRPVAVAVVQVETLVCGSCGESFERQRTRGRKPKLCPTCRGLTAPVTSA
ncbi:MAG TPA: HIRAN domain-containing protein [Gaiellaceae bacterium]|nr:HIRAN domain-containing protein [Gaiellaceae bacterium]